MHRWPGVFGERAARRPVLGSFGAVLLLLALGNAADEPFGETSVIIGYPEKILSSQAIDRIDPADPDAPITEYRYDVRFVITNLLAGRDLGDTARISMVGYGPLQKGKLFMLVHRDGVGRLWARRAWQRAGRKLCLLPQQIVELDLVRAFATARDNGKGQRCINIERCRRNPSSSTGAAITPAR